MLICSNICQFVLDFTGEISANVDDIEKPILHLFSSVTREDNAYKQIGKQDLSLGCKLECLFQIIEI